MQHRRLGSEVPEARFCAEASAHVAGTVSMLALSLTRFLPPMPFWSAGRLGFPSGVVAVAMTDRTFGESHEVVCRAVSGLPLMPVTHSGHLTCLDSTVGGRLWGQSGQCTRKAVDCTLAK